MKKYKYNSDLECFERFDKKGNPVGKKLWVNIVEARKIITLYQLGNTVGLIQSKMTFSSNKVSGKTVETIVRLWKSDDIEIDGDFPMPSKDFESLTVDGRLEDLESRICSLEDTVSELKPDCFCTCECEEKSKLSGVKSWLGL